MDRCHSIPDGVGTNNEWPEHKDWGHKLLQHSKCAALKPTNLFCCSNVYVCTYMYLSPSIKSKAAPETLCTNLIQLENAQLHRPSTGISLRKGPKRPLKPLHQLREAQRMPNFMSFPTKAPSSTNSEAPQKPMLRLPTEIRLKVYEYLLYEEVQPTSCKYPRNILKQIREEAFPVYLSCNNIIFDSSRAACTWLEHISPYLSKQSQPLHLTFDLRQDYYHPVGRNNAREADRKRLFRLLATARAKLDLTIKTDVPLVGEMNRCGALDLMHGFASASSTRAPAPAVNSRCENHKYLHQLTQIVASAVSVAERQATELRPLLDLFTSACPTGCEHLVNGAWNSKSSIHIDVGGVRCGRSECEVTNCLICFATHL